MEAIECLRNEFILTKQILLMLILDDNVVAIRFCQRTNILLPIGMHVNFWFVLSLLILIVRILNMCRTDCMSCKLIWVKINLERL